MSSFVETAQSRETSPELMDAIFHVANEDEAVAERIWRDGPTSAEQVAIIEIVTRNGMYETTDFYWGDEGNDWVQYDL
jgi:hypothetical protein